MQQAECVYMNVSLTLYVYLLPIIYFVFMQRNVSLWLGMLLYTGQWGVRKQHAGWWGVMNSMSVVPSAATSNFDLQHSGITSQLTQPLQ